MLLAPHSRLVFIGDSITAAGRSEPGEATPWGDTGYGHGYVNLVAAWLANLHPEHRIRVTNRGIGGNTVRDLAARWQRDALDLEPDWLAVMIGINDVWRAFDTPLRRELAVPLGEYRATLDRLLGEARPRLTGLVVLSPFVIEAHCDDPMRATMDAYGAACRELAATHEARFVDTQAAIDGLLRHDHPTAIAWDRIHPSTSGHFAIARAFLGAIEAAGA